MVGGPSLLGFGVSACCAQICGAQISDVPTNAAAKQMLKKPAVRRAHLKPLQCDRNPTVARLNSAINPRCRLARRENAPLATSDKTLIATARKAKIKVRRI